MNIIHHITLNTLVFAGSRCRFDDALAQETNLLAGSLTKDQVKDVILRMPCICGKGPCSNDRLFLAGDGWYQQLQAFHAYGSDVPDLCKTSPYYLNGGIDGCGILTKSPDLLPEVPVEFKKKQPVLLKGISVALSGWHRLTKRISSVGGISNLVQKDD